MRRGWRIALLLFAFAPRAAAQGPAADWRTLETRHFRIHFPAPFEAWARQAAGQIEDIHTRVTEKVGHAPLQRVEVVVADPEADANGAAIPWLDRPEIVLWAFPPGAGSSTGEFSDWVELLVTHEVAHIAHLVRPRTGVPGVLAGLSPAPFGPLVLRSPRWLIEGYATLLEGALTGSGRPTSSFRAMVLRQFAIEGRLPAYRRLGRTSGWLGGAMAYLVGSAYLEWLGARGGPDALPRVFERMGRGEGFAKAFRAVFGEPPEDLYERFRAELTERACTEEDRLKRAGLVAGMLWRRLEGGTSGLAVSPDGARVLVRRDPRPKESFVAIYDVAQGDSEPRPRWRLPRADGFSPADPRWLPDGKRVLFARRAPDSGGELRLDLYTWDFARARVARVTRGADLADADPAPDGRWAVAVRNRYGRSTLVRVDLATGQASDLPAATGTVDAWPVWNHPRVSPDGTRVAALLHREGMWRLVTLPAEGGIVTEVAAPGAPVSAPSWSPDGARLWATTDVSGIWNVAAVDVRGGGAQVRTRVTGAAFWPAPSPDGRSLFFLELTATGVNVRRLELTDAAPAPAEPPADAYPILPPPPQASPERGEPKPAPLPASAPYSAWRTQAVRSLVNFSFGPDGSAVQLGLDGGDVVGRLHWLAAASIGDAAGPRGGTLAAAWRGFPVELSVQLFSALEKPGSQSLAARPELDQERRGGYAGLAWGRPFTGGRVGIEAGGGATRVEALSNGEGFTRALGSARGRMVLRRTRGGNGVGLDLDVAGAAGSTNGSTWTQLDLGARLAGITSFGTLSAAGRWGVMGGSPTRFDLFAIGGAPSAILPPQLDRNRIESPALPAAVQLGEKFQTWRAELSPAAVPLTLYAEWMRAWPAGTARPKPVRAIGAEVRLERLVPAEYDRALTFRLGLARITSDAPRLRAVRGYAGLIYRP